MPLSKKEMQLIMALVEDNAKHALQDWQQNSNRISRESFTWYLAGTVRGWAEAHRSLVLKKGMSSLELAELNFIISHAAREFATALGVLR